MGVLTVVLCAGSWWLLPVPGSVRRVPVWQLTPPAFAALASLATLNRLPAEFPDFALRAARLAWALIILGLACLGVRAVDLAAGLGSLVPATATLVGLALGTSCVLGRMSVWVGGVGILVIVMNTHKYAGAASPWAPEADPIWVGGVALAVLGVAAYAWFGARSSLVPRT